MSLDLCVAKCLGGYNVWGHEGRYLIFECCHLHPTRLEAKECLEDIVASGITPVTPSEDEREVLAVAAEKRGGAWH